MLVRAQFPPLRAVADTPPNGTPIPPRPPHRNWREIVQWRPSQAQRAMFRSAVSDLSYGIILAAVFLLGMWFAGWRAGGPTGYASPPALPSPRAASIDAGARVVDLLDVDAQAEW